MRGRKQIYQLIGQVIHVFNHSFKSLLFVKRPYSFLSDARSLLPFESKVAHRKMEALAISVYVGSRIINEKFVRFGILLGILLFESFAYPFSIFETFLNLFQKTLSQFYIFIRCKDLGLQIRLWTKSYGCSPTRYAKSDGIQFQQTLPVIISKLAPKLNVFKAIHACRKNTCQTCNTNPKSKRLHDRTAE